MRVRGGRRRVQHQRAAEAAAAVRLMGDDPVVDEGAAVLGGMAGRGLFPVRRDDRGMRHAVIGRAAQRVAGRHRAGGGRRVRHHHAIGVGDRPARWQQRAERVGVGAELHEDARLRDRIEQGDQAGADRGEDVAAQFRLAIGVDAPAAAVGDRRGQAAGQRTAGEPGMDEARVDTTRRHVRGLPRPIAGTHPRGG